MSAPTIHLPGIALIQSERLRQILELGHSAKVDDSYLKGELTEAASTYLQCASAQEMFGPTPTDDERQAINDAISEIVADHWPWEMEWFKLADDPERNKIKAGALIAAELDRAHRQKLKARPAASYPRLTAHDTGDGWSLQIEVEEGSYALAEWPHDWPDSVAATFLRSKGFVIVP